MKIPGSKTGRCLAAAITAAAFVSVGATPSSAGPIEQEIIRNAIQNILYSVRDQIQDRRLTAPSMPGAMRFTAEESEFDNQRPFEPSAKHAFDALAYAKAPAAAAAPAPTWIYGINAIGSGDETRTGFVSTTAVSGTGAFDVTKIGIFQASDALTFVATGTGIWAHTFGLEFNTSSGAGTLAYTNGGFSTDFTAAASWSRSNALNVGIIAPPNSSMLSYTANAQYKYDLLYGAYIEPTVGVTYTELYTANFGTTTGTSTELHAGGRIGTEMKWMGFTVQPQLSGAVFKNVTQSGAVAGPVPGGPPIAIATVADTGLGGRGAGRINVIWTPNFSSFLEAHGSGVAGTKTVGFVATQTIGGSGGLRWTW
jgi:Autotransporter beta-domain